MKLNVRDLVNAGAFSLLTVMAIWVGGMIGFIPVAMPFVPLPAACFRDRYLCFIPPRSIDSG